MSTGVIYQGVKVYNMYGIGAYDNDPVGLGAKKAYEMKWTTPEFAIEDGAKWVAELFIKNSTYKQNTLYKMRWNPASPGQHQYATAINWAIAQTNDIKSLYEKYSNAILKFDIPVYKL